MANSFIQVDPDSTGKKVDTEETTVGANTVERERQIQVPGSSPVGCSIAHLVAAGGGDATSVKASAGQLYGIQIFNNATYPVYVKFHNIASAPTAGSGVVFTVGVQAGLPKDLVLPWGAAFSTGIGMTIVKGIADTNATGVAASDCVVDVFYA